MHTRRLWGLRARRVRDGKPMGQSSPICRPQSGNAQRGCEVAEHQRQWWAGAEPSPWGTCSGWKVRRPRAGAHVGGLLCLVCRHPWGSWRPGGWEWVKGAEAPGETAPGLAGFRPLMPSRHQGSHPHFRGHWQESGHGARKGHSFPPPTPPALSVPWGGTGAGEGPASPAGLRSQKRKPGHRWVTWSGSVWYWFCL